MVPFLNLTLVTFLFAYNFPKTAEMSRSFLGVQTYGGREENGRGAREGPPGRETAYANHCICKDMLKEK